MGWVASGVTIIAAIVAAAVVHRMFSAIKRPDVAEVALIVLAVVATLVIGWVVYLVSTTRSLLVRIQTELDIAPTAAPESDTDMRRVLSFSITSTVNALPDLTEYSGVGMCTCPGSPAASAHPGVFKRTVWLTPTPSAGASALTNAILSGRVKYVIIGGAVAGAAYSHAYKAVILYHLGSFQAPENCTAVQPLPAIYGTSISDEGWKLLVHAVSTSSVPLHVIAF